MIYCPLFQALGIHARRILDFLLIEHGNHGGQNNGDLAAPYAQLERFGLTKSDISKGLSELQTCGFVKLTKQGMRQAGGGEPSRYALTWLPTDIKTNSGLPAGNDWKTIIGKLSADNITDVRLVRKWLKNYQHDNSIGRLKRKVK